MQTTESSICQCSRLSGTRMLHPLVSVISLESVSSLAPSCLDCYSVWVQPGPVAKDTRGWKSCDFTDARVLARAPGTAVDISLGQDRLTRGQLLLFHRDLLAEQSLGRHISDYTYFKYKGSEALYLSACEYEKTISHLQEIDRELHWGIDPYSSRILSDRIGLLLDYVQRFYHRQFITREDVLRPLMERLRQAVDHYMLTGRVRLEGMPCACKFSAQLGVSAAYLNDVVRHVTGKSLAGYVQLRRVELAKQLIISQRCSDAKVALTLGFGSADRFRALFLSLTGMKPADYR